MSRRRSWPCRISMRIVIRTSAYVTTHIGRIGAIGGRGTAATAVGPIGTRAVGFRIRHSDRKLRSRGWLSLSQLSRYGECICEPVHSVVIIPVVWTAQTIEPDVVCSYTSTNWLQLAHSKAMQCPESNRSIARSRATHGSPIYPHTDSESESGKLVLKTRR